MTKNNKIVGFWMRFLAKGIDIILIVGFSIALSLFNLDLRPGKIAFLAPWNFYLWIILEILLWPGYFVLVPLLTKGYTLGIFICRLKIITEKKWNYKAIIKREFFFSLMISFNFLMVLIFINHTLANRFFKMTQNNIAYTTLENFRISLVSVLFSISILVQMIVGISIIVKKGSGINDIYSGTKIIYINKWIIKKEQNSTVSKKYRPKMKEQEIVEWID